MGQKVRISKQKPIARWMIPQRLSKLMAQLDKLKQQVSVTEVAKSKRSPARWARQVRAMRPNWVIANYLVATGFATVGWLYFIVWIAPLLTHYGQTRMGFTSSLLVLITVFAVGFGAGYAFRALISEMHRRRFERTRGFPME